MTILIAWSLQPFHHVQIRKRSRVGIHEGFFVGRDADAANRVHSGGVGGSNLLPIRAFAGCEIDSSDRARQSGEIVDVRLIFSPP